MEEALELQARRAGEAPATNHRPEDFLHPRDAGPGSESDEPEAPPSDAQARALAWHGPRRLLLPRGVGPSLSGSGVHASEPTLHFLLTIMLLLSWHCLSCMSETSHAQLACPPRWTCGPRRRTRPTRAASARSARWPGCAQRRRQTGTPWDRRGSIRLTTSPRVHGIGFLGFKRRPTQTQLQRRGFARLTTGCRSFGESIRLVRFS